MDTKESTRTYRLKQWTEIIRECSTSGQTVTAWCETHDVNSKSYYYWLRRVRTVACESLPVIQKKNDLSSPINSNKAVFAQIPLPDLESTDASVVLRLNGAILEIKNGASDKVIENTLRAIRNLCWVIFPVQNTYLYSLRLY